MKQIEKFCNICHGIAQDKGWWESSRSFPECLALVHAEVSEALEAYRDGSRCDIIEYDEITKKPEGIAIELADTLIRIFDLSAAFCIPLADALAVKIAYNKTRTRRHGDKVC